MSCLCQVGVPLITDEHGAESCVGHVRAERHWSIGLL